VNAAVKANALIQANLLRTGSPVIADAETQGKVKVVAAYYSLVDGTVTLLQPPSPGRENSHSP